MSLLDIPFQNSIWSSILLLSFVAVACIWPAGGDRTEEALGPHTPTPPPKVLAAATVPGVKGTQCLLPGIMIDVVRGGGGSVDECSCEPQDRENPCKRRRGERAERDGAPLYWLGPPLAADVPNQAPDTVQLHPRGTSLRIYTYTYIHGDIHRVHWFIIDAALYECCLY